MQLFFSTLAQAVTPGAPPGAPAAAPSLVATAWDMVLKGGWMMVPIALTSLVAMTIVAERLITLRRSRIAPPGLLDELRSLRAKPAQARARAANHPSPLAAVILAAINSANLPRAILERHVSEAGEREVLKLRHRLRLLSALPQTATMLGLLGTVFGMIRTFTVVAASGESLGKTERLAQGIYEAWTATAAGLVVAIPTLVMYQIVMARVDAAAAALDGAAQTWLQPEPDAAPEPLPVAPTAPDAPANSTLSAASA